MVSFGLPKHSQTGDETRHDRLHNQRPPPVVAIGSNSIIVGDLPIKFMWNSRAQEMELSGSSNSIEEEEALKNSTLSEHETEHGMAPGRNRGANLGLNGPGNK